MNHEDYQDQTVFSQVQMLMQMCREDEQGNVLVYEDLALVGVSKASVSARCDVMNVHLHIIYLTRSTVCLYTYF